MSEANKNERTDASSVSVQQYLMTILQEMIDAGATSISSPTVIHFEDREVHLIISIECVSGMDDVVEQ
jgi:hypothetical protein